MMRCAILFVLLLTASAARSQEAVDFGAQVAPLLTRNCIACHNAKKSEGGLVLESFATLMKGGDSGAAVVPGTIDKGELLSRIIAIDDTAMPPADNAVGAKRLTEAEVAIVKAWIVAGAPAPEAALATAMHWRDITGTLKPIYASDVSSDGSYLAYGVGNIVALARNPFGTTAPQIDYLLDPNLKLADGKPVQTTHIDLVQSIAFSPDSQRLATGGFRSVKIWKRQTGFAPLATPMPVGGKVLSTDMSGSRIAVASPEHALVLFDATTLQPLTMLKGHTDRIVAAVFTPNTPTVFSCDASGRLLRWDLPAELPAEVAYDEASPAPNVILVSNEAQDIRAMASANVGSVIMLRQDDKLTALQQAPPPAEAGAPRAAYAPLAAFDRFADVRTIAAAKPTDAIQYLIAQNNGIVEVVTPDTAESVIRFEQGAPIAAIAITRDGAKIGVAAASGPTRLWNLADGKTLATLHGDYDQVRTLEVAQRSVARQKALVDLLAARVPELKKEAEKEVEARKKVEEARTKAVEAIAAKVKEVETAQAQVTSTIAAIEETRKAIEEMNKKMQALAAEKEAKDKAVAEAEKKKREADAELVKHDQALAASTASVERANGLVPQQEMLVTAQTAIFNTVQQGLETIQKTALPAISALAFDTTGSTVVAAAADNSLNLFDASSGKAIAKLSPSPVAVQSIFVSTDRTLVAGDGAQWFRWNLGLPWSLERTLGSPLSNDPGSTLFSDRITALDFSPDGQSLSIGSGPPSRFGDVKIVAIETGEVQRDFGEAHSDTVLGLRYSPDGRQLATCGADKLCRLYQLDSGQLLCSFEGHTHHVLGVSWQNNGQTLATAGADNSVKSWNVATGERKQSIAGFGKEVTGIEFVGMTDQVVTSSVDGQARLHNASNAQQVRVFSGANTALYTVSASDDGQFIAAGGQSGQMWIWKIADGVLLRKIPEDPK